LFRYIKKCNTDSADRQRGQAPAGSKELGAEKSGGKLTWLSASESSIDKVEGKIRARVKQTLKGSRTEYNGSVLEEEINQIGGHCRTRQTIIFRAAEHKTIGQYLEKRIHR